MERFQRGPYLEFLYLDGVIDHGAGSVTETRQPRLSVSPTAVQEVDTGVRTVASTSSFSIRICISQSQDSQRARHKQEVTPLCLQNKLPSDQQLDK